LRLVAPGHEFIGARSLYASHTTGGIDSAAVSLDMQATSRQENMSERPHTAIGGIPPRKLLEAA